ncbi:MAG: hypothetical protein DCC71_16095, partial [Proteobacteria bacterium]
PAPAAWLRAARPAALAAPLVVATAGAVATGKSTLAKQISRRLGAPRIATDRVQRVLLDPIPERVAHELVWEPDFAERVYGAMFARAEPVLRSRRPVVLDGCFAEPAQRRGAAALAQRHGVPFVFLECVAPKADVEARLRRRDRRDGIAHGSWGAIARGLRERWQAPQPDEPGRHVRVDTGRPRREWLRGVALAPERGA